MLLETLFSSDSSFVSPILTKTKRRKSFAKFREDLLNLQFHKIIARVLMNTDELGAAGLQFRSGPIDGFCLEYPGLFSRCRGHA